MYKWLVSVILVVFAAITLSAQNFPKSVKKVKSFPDNKNLWIFILAGQSNMAGRGLVAPLDTISNNRIITIDKYNNWIYAKEPLHFYEPSRAGLDCGLSYANALLPFIPDSITIGLIPCAVGGSSIEQWLTDAEHRGVKLLSNFKEKVTLAQKRGIIKGVLWHQGESNAKDELIPNYKANLQKLTSAFRNFIGNDSLPILIGELGTFANSKEKQLRWGNINKAINTFSQNSKYIYIIDSENLVHKGDSLHFNAASQRLLGKRFAEKFLSETK